ncbi:hypothetical protein MYX84_12000 [Acidobacteria bacterium AH-259-O06]|nr:hypothetical protein [Acidobacteria bacterium AH-259-O06]
MLRPLAFLGCSFLFVTTIAIAQTRSEPTAEELSTTLQELKSQLEQMKAEYEKRISELERQIVQLSAVTPQPTTETRAAAKDVTFTGGQRTLQALNPEVSVTGDNTLRISDRSGDEEFNRLNFDGFEMAIQHPLDPYSMAKFFVTFEEGEFDLEEGYLTWESLPGSLGLKVGRFHTNFGKLNRFHKHALPWADRDLPTQTLFGEEGLIGEGLSLTWLPPRLPWAHTNEISFEVINNSNDLAFSGKGFGDPLYIGRLSNYYDVTENAYFEWGLSAATSHWDIDEQNRSTVLGLDLSYRWEPLQRALYRSLELRTELFYNARDRWPGGDVFGMYAYGEYQLSRRWYGGFRYQFGQTLEDQDQNQWALSPYVTFWQSEWVRLRAQYDFLNPNFEEDENRFFLQFTWSLGPHKHEAY